MNFLYALKKQRGFTLTELLVSSIVIILLASVVLANFRSSQYSGELEIALQHLTSDISDLQAQAFGGQLINGNFPEGGFGVYISTDEPSQYILYAASAPGASYSPGDELANGIKQLDGIQIGPLCGFEGQPGDSLPCEGTWDFAGNFFEVIFNQSVSAQANYPQPGNFDYIGAELTHVRTGEKAYFYVSLASGLVTGEIL